MQRAAASRWRLALWGALVALLLLGTTIPGSLKADIEGHMWNGVPWSGLAHFTLFAAIAAVPIYGKGWPALSRAVVLSLMLAFVTESLQSLVPGRHPLLRDALIDLAGTITGLSLRHFIVSRAVMD